MMDLDGYQRAARRTAKLDLESPIGRAELVFGLNAESGSMRRGWALPA